MGTTAAAQDMTALLGFPQARAATAGPADPGPGGVPGPHVQRAAPGPDRVDAPAGPQVPRLAAPRLPDRGLLLGRGIGRGRPGRPGPQRHLASCRRRRHPPRRRHLRPAERSEIPHPRLRVRGLREHRALRPRHLQLPQTGTGTAGPGDPAVRHRRAVQRRRDQRHHHPGPPGQAGRGRMVPAPAQKRRLVRAERTLPGRVEPRQSPHRLHRGTPPAPQPDQGRRRAQQNPAGPRPRLRAGHRPDLPVAGNRTARQAHHPRPAGRQPAPVPAARGRVVTGPGR